MGIMKITDENLTESIAEITEAIADNETLLSVIPAYLQALLEEIDLSRKIMYAMKEAIGQNHVANICNDIGCDIDYVMQVSDDDYELADELSAVFFDVSDEAYKLAQESKMKVYALLDEYERMKVV